MTQTPTDALIEKGQNRALCDAAQAIIERNYKPRPGRSADTAPNGQPYASLKTRFYTTAGEAVGELQGQLRNLNVASSGDTVWWRIKPEVEFEIQNRKWQARARFALGWARDEKLEFMPNSGFPGAYPTDGDALRDPSAGMGGQLPTWKCHKVVQADKIAKVEWLHNETKSSAFLLLEGGTEVMISEVVAERMLKMDDKARAGLVRSAALIGGYYVRYRDGYESWSPASEFEDGYTRQTL